MSTGAGGRGTLAILLTLAKMDGIPCLLPALLLCLWCITLKYGSIWLFKGVFSGFCGADVYLCGLRFLRGLCGFCVRERLGGFGACGVFASILSVFLLLCLCFVLFLVLLLLLSFACLFSLCGLFLGSFVGVVGSFSLSDVQTKRKGAKVCPLRPLLSCRGVLSIPLLRQELGNYCRRFRF